MTAAMLDLVAVGGPRQRILLPAELEAPELAEQLEQSALYGDRRLFERTLGTASGLDGSDLVLRQERSAVIRVTEQGSVSLRVPLDEPREGGRSFDPMIGAWPRSHRFDRGHPRSGPAPVPDSELGGGMTQSTKPLRGSGDGGEVMRLR